MRRRGLHADRLAGQIVDADALDAGILTRHDCRRRIIIFVGEIDGLFAFLGDRDRGIDHIELAGDQRRNDPVEVLVDELALGLQLVADGVHDVDVEAAELAAGVDRLERRIGGVGSNADGLLILGDGQRSGGQDGNEGCRDTAGDSHEGPLFLVAFTPASRAG
jgi:hypothetical protein